MILPLALAAVVGVGAWLLRKSNTPDLVGPAIGATRLRPDPLTSSDGRIYYVVERWDGMNWAEYGRRYLGP